MFGFSAHHRFSLHGYQGRLEFTLRATLSAPWTVLFGPSGSGKSTVLRALAGDPSHLQLSLERNVGGSKPDQRTREAEVLASSVAGESWQALHVAAPQKRALTLAPQQPLLFPHLSVLNNIRFPEKLRGLPNTQSQVESLVALLRLEPLLKLRPHQLSGGEQQRVSLARALAVPHARLLLLDEPFAGWDRALRNDLLPSIEKHLHARSLPVLSVTHDPDEALLLHAEVLRFHQGQLLQQGPARLVLEDEVNRLRKIIG